MQKIQKSKNLIILLSDDDNHHLHRHHHHFIICKYVYIEWLLHSYMHI